MGYTDTSTPVEYEFIDGDTEFRGYLTMNDEIAPMIEADETGFVEFSLAAGGNIELDWEVIITRDGENSKQFNTDVQRYTSASSLMSSIQVKLNAGEDVYTEIITEQDGCPIGTFIPLGASVDQPIAAWSLDANGKIMVYVGPNKVIEKGINFTYTFKDPTFDSKNLFSVDYKNGILFLSEDLDKAKTRVVSYKTAN